MIPPTLRTRDRTRRSSPQNDTTSLNWARRQVGPSFMGGDVVTWSISDLTAALACNSEAVCQHYLPNGRREGRYWMVGDVRNTPGRSMFVRLTGPDTGKDRAGKWADAASGENGDLLDIIRERCGLADFAEVAEEARRFLSLPQPDTSVEPKLRPSSGPSGSPGAARRLFAMAQPINGTLVETYLRNRGITALQETGALRFHPCCYYRPDPSRATETWPAMIAAVTDLDGRITGAHRTWLDLDGFTQTNLGKAPLDTPRRAMGHLIGHAVRFGAAHDVMAAGEGIETTLSLRMALPRMPMAAALSAAHLAAILFPAALRRLYVIRDDDPAGNAAMDKLIDRTIEAGIEAIALSPRREDFNEDLRHLGIDALQRDVRLQIAPDDVDRFMDLCR
jgi:Toprim domain